MGGRREIGLPEAGDPMGARGEAPGFRGSAIAARSFGDASGSYMGEERGTANRHWRDVLVLVLNPPPPSITEGLLLASRPL